MKRFLTSLVALCAMPLLLFGQEEAQLPYLEARKDASGRYGYFDEEGNNVIPCIFDWALSFSHRDVVSKVKSDGLYYLIDRSGRIFLGEGYENSPDVYDHFACVQPDDDSGHYIIDFAGRRLSPEGWSVIPVERDSWYGDPVLFAMAPLGDEQNGYYLADFRFEPLSEVRASKYRHMVYCPEVIEYTDRSDGALCYGVMNAAGEVLVEAGPGTEWLDEERLSNLDESYDLIRKSGTYGLYSDEEQNNEMVFILCSGDGKSFLCDITGQEVVPLQKANSHLAFYKRNIKDYIAPYLRHHQQNRERFAERVAAPFDSCEAWALELAPKAVPTESVALADRKEAASDDGEDGFFGMAAAMAGATVDRSEREAAEKTEEAKPVKGAIPESYDLFFASEKGGIIRLVGDMYAGSNILMVFDLNDKVLFTSNSDITHKDGYFTFHDIDDSSVTVKVKDDWSSVTFGGKVYDMSMTRDEMARMLGILAR